MNRSPKSKPDVTIFLYIAGLSLVITAIIILLKGLGVIGAIPGYVIGALILLTVGFGIIWGIRR